MPTQAQYPEMDWHSNLGTNFEAAKQQLNMSSEEQFLYNHHLGNLRRGGIRGNGGASTYKGITAEIDGRVYMLPTIWDNKRLSEEESVRRAKEVGLDKFPFYNSEEEAQKRYGAIHEFMDMDVQK
jgi:hypothetical protein